MAAAGRDGARVPEELVYMNELSWAKEHGLATSLEEWQRLPAWVHQDAHALMEFELNDRRLRERRPPGSVSL